MNRPIHAKADIIPYTAEYERTVLSWIDSPETYKAVCRGNEFPPPPNLVESWQRDDIAAYLLFAHNKPVAYAELWDRSGEMAMEIAHLLVAPFRRGRGFGATMLELLYQRAVERARVIKVIMHLYDGDETVLGCYLKAGFELVGTTAVGSGLRMVRLAENV